MQSCDTVTPKDSKEVRIETKVQKILIPTTSSEEEGVTTISQTNNNNYNINSNTSSPNDDVSRKAFK